MTFFPRMIYGFAIGYHDYFNVWYKWPVSGSLRLKFECCFAPFSSDGPHTNDSLFLILLFLETVVQVITDIYDAVLGAVKCEVLNSIGFVPLHFQFFNNNFRNETVSISSFWLLFFHSTRCKGSRDFDNIFLMLTARIYDWPITESRD